jgi:transmembrane 9 superfamily protein 2/4
LLVTTTVFLCLFQFGIVNQSMGANILTPTLLLYTISSVVGGYVTGRLLAVFHWTVKDAIKACLTVATVYPVIGMVTIHMVYDVLPGSTAPDYRVLAHSGILMAVWLLTVIPLTVAGGVWGHRGGAMTHFPVTQGASGYQDLALQPADGTPTDDEDVAKWYCCHRDKCRMPMLLLVGGILPVICCFIEYSYGVAGPIYRDYYSEYRFGFVTFFLFCTCVGLVTLLLYYGQLRVNNYSWWWASFATGASSGIYIFILSMSWLFSNVVAEAHIDASSIGIYFFWFAFLSLGVALITGFVGVACCVEFNRLLYYNAMRRGNQ